MTARQCPRLRGTPLSDAPIEQPPGLSLHPSRCHFGSGTHGLRPTLVSQSWTAGGREAKIYQQRQQPAHRRPKGSMRTTLRSGPSPRLSIDHAGTALKANTPLRMALCNKLQKCGTRFSLVNGHRSLVRTESGPLSSGTLHIADRCAASSIEGRTCRYSA